MTRAERGVLLAERGEGVHRGEHAGVGEPEVAEVVVGAVLPAEHGVVAGHLALDERVADAGAHPAGAGRGDDLGDLGRADDVVDDGDVSGIRAVGDRAGDLAAGDERGDRAGAHRFSALVDDEAAVGVAVEGQADVGVVLADGGLEVDEVLGVEGVGLVVGEVAVELEVEGDDGRAGGRSRPAAVPRTAGTVWPPMPLPASTTTLSGRMPREVDQAAQEGGVVGEDVALLEGVRWWSVVASCRRRRRRGRRSGCARRGRGRRRGRCPGRPGGRRRGTS